MTMLCYEVTKTGSKTRTDVCKRTVLFKMHAHLVETFTRPRKVTMTEEESTRGSLKISAVNTASRRKFTSSCAIAGEFMINGSKFSGTAEGNRTIIGGIY